MPPKPLGLGPAICRSSAVRLLIDSTSARPNPDKPDVLRAWVSILASPLIKNWSPMFTPERRPA